MQAAERLIPAPSRRRIAPAAAALAAVAIVAVTVTHRSAAPTAAPASPAVGATGAPARVAPFGDAGYLALADRLQVRLDARWDARAGRYRPGGDLTETMVNANELLVHAVAAEHGHRGPSRADARARSIVRWLTASPVFTDRLPAHRHKQSHAPGWIAETGGWQQHLVIDADVVDGLTHAYRARRALGLPPRSVRLVRDRIHRVATGPYWRWPTIRLNQFNWHVLVFAGDATVTGDGTTLARGTAAYLERFLADVGGRGRRAGNLGPGLRFHYLPDEPAANRMNVDTAEYANIVLGFSRFYAQARAAGMPRPAAPRLRLLREWVRRAVAGYWTHGGYASWDTGHGFERLYQQKKLALMQQALMGVAAARELQPTSAWGRWAKWLLDRSLAWYDAEATRAGRIPSPVAFGVAVAPQSGADAALGAARMAANAARAIDAGLGSVRAVAPPALYAYDPDTGRLAVTTRAYSTAIVAVNQGAFPYGGVDLARLMDARGRVAATIGGRPPASFGVVVRGGDGRLLLASQRGRVRLAAGTPPLRLLRAPEGVGVRADVAPARAYAGPFRALVAEGTTRAGGIVATSRHRFTAAAIESRWSLAGRLPAGARAEALFPTWGRAARAVARLRDGRSVRLGRTPVALRRIVAIDVTGDRGAGYRIAPLARPAAATVALAPTRPQPAAPTPGPTVAVRFGGRAPAPAFGARITVRG